MPSKTIEFHPETASNHKIHQQSESLAGLEDLKRLVSESDELEYLITYEGNSAIISSLSSKLESFLGNPSLNDKDLSELYRKLSDFFPDEYAKTLLEYAYVLAKLGPRDYLDMERRYFLDVLEDDRVVYYQVNINIEHISYLQNDSVADATVIKWNKKEIEKKFYEEREKSNELISPTLPEFVKAIENSIDSVVNAIKFLHANIDTILDSGSLDNLPLEYLAALDNSLVDWRLKVQKKIKNRTKANAPKDSVARFEIWQPSSRDENGEVVRKPYTYLRLKWRDGKNTHTKNIRSIPQDTTDDAHLEELLEIIQNKRRFAELEVRFSEVQTISNDK